MRKIFLTAGFLLSLCNAVEAGNVDTFGIGAKATALGGAFSAYADDVYAVYYNPAGLTQIESPTVSVGFEVLNPTLKIHDFKAVDGDGTPVLPFGVSFEDTSDNLVVPHAGFATRLFENIYFGIAAYVPYGLHIKWDDEVSRNPSAYNGFESYYLRAVVTPTVAVKLTDKLAAGFGVSFGRSEAGTQRRLYFPTSPTINGRVIKGDMSDDFNVSFNVGFLYKPYDNLSVGLTYRSRTYTDFEGTVEVVGIDKVHASTKIDHPEQLQIGVKYQPNKKLTLTADVVWTNWSAVEDYTVKFSRPLLGKTEEYFKRDWKDTRQVRFGVEYKWNEIVTLRGGYFYDPSPIPDHTFDMLWPDADKKTYSLGMGLHFGRLTVDTVLQYVIAEYKREVGGESSNLNNSYLGVAGNPGTVSLSADGHLWGYGLTVSYKF